MRPSIPTINQCLQLMEDFSMWENIRRHSFMVARVADLLQRGLTEYGKATVVPERDLVIAGALLHDIAKTQCIAEHCRHAEVGAALCDDLGYPQIGEIVNNHVILSHFRNASYAAGDFKAMELVFYADKRVKHDEVVTLDVRLEYILGKYGNNSPQQDALIVENFETCRTLEKHLFACLDFAPAEVPALLQNVAAELQHYPPENRRSDNDSQAATQP